MKVRLLLGSILGLLMGVTQMVPVSVEEPAGEKWVLVTA